MRFRDARRRATLSLRQGRGSQTEPWSCLAALPQVSASAVTSREQPQTTHRRAGRAGFRESFPYEAGLVAGLACVGPGLSVPGLGAAPWGPHSNATPERWSCLTQAHATACGGDVGTAPSRGTGHELERPAGLWPLPRPLPVSQRAAEGARGCSLTCQGEKPTHLIKCYSRNQIPPLG